MLGRISVLGALYLCVVCLIPEVLGNIMPGGLFTSSGTSLLIIVNVVLDTLSQIQTHIFTSRYDVLVKRMKYRDK
ncbi:secY translocase family protein [Orientia chuto str. Dubai]|uniref:SecY translocase family protein n=1 Tax=Orientia chuto str. Dubai TaxID=1359168 RepID=A0A0F3MHM7_9RICK|nr:secY translocase family protein [Orientia chuto str. Dubai]